MTRPQRESERDVVARPERPGAIRYTTSPAEARRYADLPARRISTRGSAGSGEQEDLTAGTSRLEVAVGVGRGGEGVAVADIGFEDTVASAANTWPAIWWWLSAAWLFASERAEIGDMYDRGHARFPWSLGEMSGCFNQAGLDWVDEVGCADAGEHGSNIV
jgi:hypothetical protein